MASLMNSDKIFKDELTTILHKLFQEVEEEVLLHSLFSESNITLLPEQKIC